VIRTCRELGIRTVAVHSDIDAEALHTRLADEAICIGPADPTRSYLHIPAIIAAAEITGADAVHPGYGFLSENAEFAETCAQCSLEFIGPLPEQMRKWGDKVSARALAKSLGLPTIDGTELIEDVEDGVEKAEALGFPVLLKASGGGGGQICALSSRRRARSHARRLATMHSISKSSSNDRGTSSSRSSATSTATSMCSASGSARSSAAIKRSSKKPRAWLCPMKRVAICRPPFGAPWARPATSLPERLSSCSTTAAS